MKNIKWVVLGIGCIGFFSANTGYTARFGQLSKNGAKIMTSRLPRKEISPANQKVLQSLGAKPLNLYKVLDHHPRFLKAWLEFAYSLRSHAKTQRDLRELMILRGAQIMDSEYEWFQHYKMAKAAGVTDTKIMEIETWERSKLFTERERTALKLMEALMIGKVGDELDKEVKANFAVDEQIELIITGSFYAMVPRVLDALQIPIEVDTTEAPSIDASPYLNSAAK